MHSYFPKKFTKETLHFPGYWTFLKKWNNETIASKILLRSYYFNSPPQRFIPPQMQEKNLSPQNFRKFSK